MMVYETTPPHPAGTQLPDIFTRPTVALEGLIENPRQTETDTLDDLLEKAGTDLDRLAGIETILEKSVFNEMMSSFGFEPLVVEQTLDPLFAKDRLALHHERLASLHAEVDDSLNKAARFIEAWGGNAPFTPIPELLVREALLVRAQYRIDALNEASRQEIDPIRRAELQIKTGIAIGQKAIAMTEDFGSQLRAIDKTAARPDPIAVKLTQLVENEQPVASQEVSLFMPSQAQPAPETNPATNWFGAETKPAEEKGGRRGARPRSKYGFDLVIDAWKRRLHHKTGEADPELEQAERIQEGLTETSDTNQPDPHSNSEASTKLLRRVLGGLRKL